MLLFQLCHLSPLTHSSWHWQTVVLSRMVPWKSNGRWPPPGASTAANLVPQVNPCKRDICLPAKSQTNLLGPWLFCFVQTCSGCLSPFLQWLDHTNTWHLDKVGEGKAQLPTSTAEIPSRQPLVAGRITSTLPNISTGKPKLRHAAQPPPARQGLSLVLLAC